MEIQSKDELHRLSSFNFWCHNKGDEKSCSGMFKREILDTKLLRHGTNDLQSEKSTTKIASNITNMALSAENKTNTTYFSGLIVKPNIMTGREKKLT